MGFLDRLKELFSEGKEKTGEKIENVDSWLERKREEIESRLGREIEDMHKEIFSVLDDIDSGIAVLESVDLSEKREDERLKNIVLLGREDYIRGVRKLTENLRQSDKTNYEIGSITLEIDKFMKGSAKSHFKATQLIGKEIGNISDKIRKIRKIESDFIEGNKNLVDDRKIVNELLQKVEERERSREKKSKIAAELGRIEQSYKNGGTQLEDLDRKIALMKSSSEYKERDKLAGEIRKSDEALKTLEFEIGTLVDKRILEKYAYLDLGEKRGEFVQAYIKNPVNVLLSDSWPEILDVLKDVRDKINDRTITVKETGKAVEKMELEKNIFLGLRDKTLSLRSKRDELDSKIREIRLDFDEIADEKKIVEGKLTEYKSRISVFSRKLDGINKVLNSLNGELSESEVRRAFNEKL